MQATLSEQGVCPSLGGAGFEMVIEAESLAGGAEHRQQGDREGIEQPQAVASLRRVDADLPHDHTKMRIFSIPEAASPLLAHAMPTARSLSTGFGLIGARLERRERSPAGLCLLSPVDRVLGVAPRPR